MWLSFQKLKTSAPIRAIEMIGAFTSAGDLNTSKK